MEGTIERGDPVYLDFFRNSGSQILCLPRPLFKFGELLHHFPETKLRQRNDPNPTCLQIEIEKRVIENHQGEGEQFCVW